MRDPVRRPAGLTRGRGEREGGQEPDRQPLSAASAPETTPFRWMVARSRSATGASSSNWFRVTRSPASTPSPLRGPARRRAQPSRESPGQRRAPGPGRRPRRAGRTPTPRSSRRTRSAEAPWRRQRPPRHTSRRRRSSGDFESRSARAVAHEPLHEVPRPDSDADDSRRDHHVDHEGHQPVPKPGESVEPDHLEGLHAGEDQDERPDDRPHQIRGRPPARRLQRRQAQPGREPVEPDPASSWVTRFPTIRLTTQARIRSAAPPSPSAPRPGGYRGRGWRAVRSPRSSGRRAPR